MVDFDNSKISNLTMSSTLRRQRSLMLSGLWRLARSWVSCAVITRKQRVWRLRARLKRLTYATEEIQDLCRRGMTRQLPTPFYKGKVQHAEGIVKSIADSLFCLSPWRILPSSSFQPHRSGDDAKNIRLYIYTCSFILKCLSDASWHRFNSESTAWLGLY